MNYRTLCLSAALLGCAGTRAPAASAPISESQPALASAEQPACCVRCPLALPGVRLSYAESTGGGSLVFDAPAAELAELRARVAELASYHNSDHQKLAMMTLPHEARSVETDSGARLEITTSAGNDLPALQREIENEVQWLQAGNCQLDGQPCNCGMGSATPLSGSSETAAPTDHGARDSQPAGPSAP